MDFNIYPNDDPVTAARKIHKDYGSFTAEKAKKPKSYTAYKYSRDIPLAEEIQLGNQNVFLQIIDREPETKIEIDLGEKKNVVIRPHQTGEATPIIPYTFNDIDEIKCFIEQAEKESIHSLLSKSKSLWKHFVVAKDKDMISLLAIDQVYSYFQDLFATTHYDMVTGSPGSGKGAILLTMKLLGYRVVLASDMSGANLLDILGPVEPGQVVVAEDEFDDIDKDEIKLKVVKVGYDEEGIVPRTLDGNTSARHNNWYYVYGFKIFAAESPAESKNLGGFNDRTFRIESIKSNPRFRIKTVLKEARKSVDKQNPKYRDIISKAVYLRKLLLVYRLIHNKDIIEEVPLNIDGRAWELASPQIFLFNSDKLSNGDKPALHGVLTTLSRFLQKKGELTKKTIEGIVHEALEELFPNLQAKIVTDVNGRSITTYTISNEMICDIVRVKMDGTPSTIPNEYAFYSTDYGKITYKRILKICRDRFSAEQDSIGTGNEKVRALTFDKETIEKVGKTFEIISQIKITQEPAENEGEDEADNWDIPFLSQDRPTENVHNYAQGRDDGMTGRKNGESGGDGGLSDVDALMRYLAERQSHLREAPSKDNSQSPRNGPVSVPTSQPIPEGSSGEDKAARLREYERLSALSRKKSKAAASESLDENETKSNDNSEK